VKEGTALRPIVRGGSQERDIRPGTHDLPSIGAMVVALEEAQSQRSTTHEYLIKIRDLFEERLTALLPNVSVNALNGDRSPAISNLLFPGTTNEEMLYLLDGAGVYASGGAACASGALDPSHVIMALGVDKLLAKSALRFSFSTSNTAEEIIEASEIVAKVYLQLTGGQL
ncbi:aminotransferase class V, partial [mine drainage metagenome]